MKTVAIMYGTKAVFKKKVAPSKSHLIEKIEPQTKLI